MQRQASVLGNEFSNWSELTDEYMAGMQALRRREPGASAKMMEIAKLMSHYQQLGGAGSVIKTAPLKPSKFHQPSASNWFKTIAANWFRGHDSLAPVH